MIPPKFNSPRQFVRITRQDQRLKERMQQLENVIELEDVTTSDLESINPTWVEEETYMTQQGEIGKNSEDQNCSSNPNLETPAKPDETMGLRQSLEHKQVVVEDNTNWSESARKEEGAEEAEERTSVAGHKRKAWDTMDITLPYLPDAVLAVDDMLGKVPKFRYANHDVHDVAKFPDLANDLSHKQGGNWTPRYTRIGARAADNGALQLRNHEHARHTAFQTE